MAEPLDPATWVDAVTTAVQPTPVVRRIVEALAEHARHGDIAPGRYRLAADVDCTPTTVMNAYRRLIAGGWLHRLNVGGNGHGDRSRYRLAVPQHAAVSNRATEEAAPR